MQFRERLGLGATLLAAVVIHIGAHGQSEIGKPTEGIGSAAGCAPMLTYAEPASELRVIGTQDPTVRLIYGPGDVILIGGGSTQGLQVGQQYYVRRLPMRFGARRPDRKHPAAVHTVGWLRIESVEQSSAAASVVRACDAMQPGDYLEPFTSVAVPTDRPPATVRYNDLAAVLSGDEDRTLAGPADWMVIDRGSERGVAVGDRVVILRDKRAGAIPLVEIGQGIVILVRLETATVQVTTARDAIRGGDLVALVK